MATEEWIQESLGRLESLEEERKKHEDALETASDPATLRMHTQAIDRLEVKIRALYAELEAVAAEADSDESASEEVEEASATELEPEPEPAPVRAAPAAPPAAAPFSSPPPAAPFGSPPASAPFGSAPASPFGDAPAAPFASAPVESPSLSAAASYDLDDTESTGSGGSKIGLIIGLVVVLGGAGAYFVLAGKAAEEAPPPPPPTEIKVIKSGEIPPDTQGPRAAQAGDISFTQGAQIKETERRTGGGSGGGSPSSTPSSSEPKKKKDDKTKIESTDDPLAGIR